MRPNDDIDDTDETNRTDEPNECEFCGEEFDDEPALFDHWFRADPDVHDLDDEQLSAVLGEQKRQRKKHRQRVDVTVEIPREDWEWAVNRFELDDHDSDGLPDPNENPAQAADLLELHFEYKIVDGSDSADEQWFPWTDEADE